MEDATSLNSTQSTRADEITQTLNQQRGELEAFLAAHRERLSGAQAELTGQIQHLAQQLDQARSEIRRTQQEQSSRSEQLALEAENIAGLKQALQTAQDEWRKAQDRTIEQQRQLADQIDAQQKTLVGRLDELAERQTQVAEAQARLHHDEKELSLTQAQVEQQATQLKSLDNERAELLTQLDEARETAGQVEAATSDRLQQLQSRLDEAIEHESSLENELNAAREACTQLEGKLTDQAVGQPTENPEATERLHAERDALAERLVESQQRLGQLQRQLDELQAGSTAGEHEDHDRRYETAMKELQRLKARNEELEEQLTKTQQGKAALATLHEGSVDWEAQKQQLLAALEDFDEEDEEDVAKRVKIEEVIQTTSAAIAGKDQQITELRQTVERQAGQAESTVNVAAALEEILDRDTVVQEEREKLRRLQDEFEQKIRQAEIEIAIQRAEIARQRVEVEEIMRQFSEEQRLVSETSNGGSAGDDKWAGRRWLARLGLKKQEEENS